MTSSLPPLVQACSGALGSATANAISYPLDLSAAKLQTTTSPKLKGLRGIIRVWRYTVHKEGFSGLYDGLGADTASTLISNFLYFYFYTLLHAFVARRRTSSDSTPLLKSVKHAFTSPTRPVLFSASTELAVGFVAGVASRAISTPLNVITVRMQTSDEEESDSDDDTPSIAEKIVFAEEPVAAGRRATFTEVVRSIYAEEGLSGFWAGFQPTLPLCLSPALTFLLIQFISRLRLPWGTPSHKPSAIRIFLGGAIANALTVTILYPLLLAKVRLQAARANSLGTKACVADVTDVWVRVVKSHGWRGLYQALGVQILKGFVNQGVTMLVKQRFESAIVRAYTSRQ